MAGVWEGFTEEDIGFYKKSTGETNIPKKKAANLQGLVKKNVTREKTLGQLKDQMPKVENSIPQGAKLYKNPQESLPLMEKEEQDSKQKEKETEKEKEKEVEETKETGPIVMGSNPVCLRVIEGKAYELVNKNYTEVSKATLEVFEARQKTLEEQNKKRKEMLAKVISARKKQTTEEAKRLQHIQEELQKLDLLLSNDVGILRNKIEESSLDFAEAQKRYNKAEKEFLDAKQNLLVKLEKKELLTKLLCTIIEQNEMRKAQKLSELMEKLKINETGSVNPEPQSALNGTPDTKTPESDKEKQPS